MRIRVLARDKYTCQSCGINGENVKLQVDHIIPKSKGGVTEDRNLQTLCFDCNMGKRNFQIPPRSNENG